MDTPNLASLMTDVLQSMQSLNVRVGTMEGALQTLIRTNGRDFDPQPPNTRGAPPAQVAVALDAQGTGAGPSRPPPHANTAQGVGPAADTAAPAPQAAHANEPLLIRVEQRSEEWHTMRNQRITASAFSHAIGLEIAKIKGLANLQKIWREKVGLLKGEAPGWFAKTAMEYGVK